jgi:hypothetical protein
MPGFKVPLLYRMPDGPEMENTSECGLLLPSIFSQTCDGPSLSPQSARLPWTVTVFCSCDQHVPAGRVTSLPSDTLTA